MKFDDSTMILKVFWCPEGSQDLPKSTKNDQNSAPAKKTEKMHGESLKLSKRARQVSILDVKVRKSIQKGPPKARVGGGGGALWHCGKTYIW